MKLVPCLLTLTLLAGCPKPVDNFPSRSCVTTISFKPDQTVNGQVSIRGEWKGFSDEPMPKQSDNAFVYTSTLESRDYAYDLVVGGQVILDPHNAFRRWAAGAEHSRLRVGDCRVPMLTVSKFQAEGSGDLNATVQYVDGSEKKGPDTGKLKITLDGATLDSTSLWDKTNHQVALHESGLAAGKHNVRINISDAAGRATDELYLPFWIEKTHYAWQDATLYSVVTDRFKNGDASNDRPTDGVKLQANYQGGDFNGVTQAINDGYFDRLGANAIWLSPFYKNPDGYYGGDYGQNYTAYHGYWPNSPRETQARFGSLDDLRALTAAAHRHGIRIMADIVLNDVHTEHPYWAQHQADGWFNNGTSYCICGAPGCNEDARLCWFQDYLPDLNWRTSAAGDQLIADTLWWVKEADLDAVRLDAVKHVDHVATAGVAGTLRDLTAKTGLDYYVLGETLVGNDDSGRSEINSYVGPEELDGQFDYPLYWPVRGAFAGGASLKQVEAAVMANHAAYSSTVLNSTFLGNHDQPRFISDAAGELDSDPKQQAWNDGHTPPLHLAGDAKLSAQNRSDTLAKMRYAWSFVLTQSGVPLMYYGDEIAMMGCGDPDNRRMMRFGPDVDADEKAMLAFVQRLGNARRNNHGLRGTGYQTLTIEDDAYAYERWDDRAGEGSGVAVVVINRADTARTLSLTLPHPLAGSTLKDVLSSQTVTVSGGSTSVTVPAKGVAVLVEP